jgi:WD40 repeat protein
MSDRTGPHRCCLRVAYYLAHRTAFDRAANLLMGSGWVPRLWDLTTGRLLRALPITGFYKDYAHWAIALTPDGGRAVASFSSGYHVLVWDTASGEELLRWNAQCVATGMAVTGDRALIGARISKLLMLYDLNTGAELFRVKTRTSATETVAISDDGRLGLSGGGDKRIRLWDLTTGRLVLELSGHTGRVHALDFGPGDATAVSGASDKTVRVWDLKAGRELACFQGHTRIVDCVAFAPDGSSVASGARDLTVRVWDLPDGRERCFRGHNNNLTTVAYKPDGQTLVSAGHQDVWAWDLTAPPDERQSGDPPGKEAPK